MELLRNLIHADYWHWYDMVSALFGVILCFVLKKKHKYIYCISVLICIVNAFWLGAVFLFGFYYHACSFFYGGMIGAVLIILCCILLKSKMVYLAGIFICAKLTSLFCNMFIQHNCGQVEELIVGCSYFFAVIVILAINTYLIGKKKGTYEDYSNKILFPLYGSFLITGCWFNIFYESEYEMAEYLFEDSEYINFYKYIAKIDWVIEDGGTIIFVVMFLFISLVGYVMQNYNINKN